MTWNQARQKLLHLATGRPQRSIGSGSGHGELADRGGENGHACANGASGENGKAAPQGARAASLCIASGKGGTGKSVVTASLASLFAARGRTLLVDADLGVGNAHILQDISPSTTFVDVVEGRLAVREALIECREDLDLAAAGSGVPRMAELSSFELHLIAAGLEELEADYRFVLIDSAAGVSRQTLAFARSSDVVLIVTTPDLTAMTDAYAFLKLLVAGRPTARPLLLVNRAQDEEQAEETARRILRVGERFLGVTPKRMGWLPEDPAVSASVNRRGAVVDREPGAEVSRCLRRMAVNLLEELGRIQPAGLGRTLAREVDYAARPA